MKSEVALLKRCFLVLFRFFWAFLVLLFSPCGKRFGFLAFEKHLSHKKTGLGSQEDKKPPNEATSTSHHS